MISRYISFVDQLAKGGWLNAILTFIAGASLISAFSPLSLWWMIFPGLVWFLLPLKSISQKQSLLRTLWFNLGFFGVGISWVHVSVHRFGHAPLPISVILTLGLVLLMSLFSLVSIYCLNRYFQKHSNKIYFLVAFPFTWVLFEWFRSWVFTGFPWLLLGQSQIDGYLNVWATVLGSSAISFLIVLITSLITLSIREGKKVFKITLPMIGVVIISTLLISNINWLEVTDKKLNVSVLQPSIPQERKWLPEVRSKTLKYLRQQSALTDADLIVWPEAAVPVLARAAKNYLNLVSNEASNKSQAILTGIPVKQDDKYYNAAIMLGNGTGKYFKQHLVPFGEYVPFEAILRGLIEFFDLPMSSFSPGNTGQALLTAGEWNIAMAICYEIVFQDVVAKQLRGADVLVTISNDAWFGDSLGSYQHLEIARMRALENGIPIIRASNDGISALIDHKGNVIGKMGKYEKGLLSGELSAVKGTTLYRTLGPSWSYFLILLIPGLILLFAYRSHND